MHVEPPDSRLHSLRDFARHYLMIVLSILTALGLEAWIEHVHHRQAAEAAVRSMQVELRENLVDTRNSLQRDLATLQGIEKLDETLTADLSDNVDTATINKHIHAQHDALQLNLSTPSLPSYAWDTAVANQALSWIDGDELKKYSAAYASQRGMSDWIAHDLVVLLDIPQFVNLSTDIRLGRPVDPLALLHSVRQVKVTLSAAVSNLQDLQKQLIKAVGEPPAPARTP